MFSPPKWLNASRNSSGRFFGSCFVILIVLQQLDNIFVVATGMAIQQRFALLLGLGAVKVRRKRGLSRLQNFPA